MAVTSLDALQVAVFTVLNNNIIQGGVTVPVFDHVPQGTGFPYVTIGEATEVRYDTHDRAGKEATLTLHVWSRYAGYKEALEIVGQIDSLLDRTRPTVTGWSVVSVTNDFTQTMTADGITRHVVARYRVKLQAT